MSSTDSERSPSVVSSSLSTPEIEMKGTGDLSRRQHQIVLKVFHAHRGRQDRSPWADRMERHLLYDEFRYAISGLAAQIVVLIPGDA